MSDEPRDGGRDDASAPWERPGRWSHQRTDATTVEDLLARLDNTDAPGESRRQRRAAPDSDEAVPAGELIAALTTAEAASRSANVSAGLAAPVTEAADDVPEGAGATAATDPADVRDVSGAAAVPTAAPVSAGGAIAESAAEDFDDTPAALHIAPVSPGDNAEPIGDASPPSDDVGTDLDVVAVTAPAVAAAADGPAETADPDIAAATTEVHEPVPAGAHDDTDDGPHTQPIGPVVEPAGHSDVERDSILASLRRELGVESAAAADAGTGKPRTRAYGDPHQHRGWWTAGRAAVAAVAALVLLITGTEWTIKHRADQVLADNHISAIVPDDTNISTPTANDPTDASAAGGSAGGTAKQSAAVNPAANQVYQPENILMMGSDTRVGKQNTKIGGSAITDPTMQSDVLMIAHLSADRQHVTVLSIPRDLYIHAPSCKAWDYTTNTLSNQDYVSPYTEWKITNAYSVGGPQCTVKAVQELTGLKITRVIIIDFAGFKDMVDALDGISINVCKPIVDAQLGTVIATPGVQKIDGAQALNMVRARKVVGDPSGDLGRIRRQQVVLATLLRQVTNAGVLLNPAKLDSLLQAFTHNVKTDNVTLDDLLQLAQSLGNLSASRVTFYTLPTVADGDGLDATAVAPGVFNALVNDQPLPGEATAAPTTKKTAASTTPTPAPTPTRSSSSTSVGPRTLSVPPGSVELRVVNVSGRANVATNTMTSLDKLGFAVTDADLLLEDPVQTAVTVQYDPTNEAAALTVAAAVPGATLVPTAGLGTVVKLMLGSGFDGTVQAVAVGQTVTPTVSSASSSSQSSASSAAPSTSSAAQTLTTQQISGVNADSAGCA